MGTKFVMYKIKPRINHHRIYYFIERLKGKNHFSCIDRKDKSISHRWMLLRSLLCCLVSQTVGNSHTKHTPLEVSRTEYYRSNH